MKLIAHRGNVNGKSIHENKPSFIEGAINRGFDCEVDIRNINGKYYLGHDYPEYQTKKKFLKQPELWCHAKDGTTLRQALKDGLHVFYDKAGMGLNYALTSRGYIWHFDGESLVYVMDKNGLIGMCSDYVGRL